jgi:hypothetical protein
MTSRYEHLQLIEAIRRKLDTAEQAIDSKSDIFWFASLDRRASLRAQMRAEGDIPCTWEDEQQTGLWQWEEIAGEVAKVTRD